MKITKTSSMFTLLKQRERISAFTLIELLVVIAIIAILASIALPVFSSVQERGKQTKDLGNAKQIALACKLFAGDHDGKFPYQNGTSDPPVDVPPPGTTSNANAIFASLIPTYTSQEKIFNLPGSAWSPIVPNENTTSGNRLEASTNNFGYMFGLTDTDNPSYPLVFDAPSTAAGLYVVNPGSKGGVWKGKKAIVIRADASGTVENIDPSTLTILGKTGGASPANILVPTLGPPVWMDPAVNAVLLPNTP
jgi:prepilin-type N-terminal cleavage/methylation domain-containing protein